MTASYENTAYALNVSHIKKHYGRHAVLNDITFQAGFGECIGILGENGCGKSTLLSILAGALKPSEGSLLFGTENPLKKPRLFSSMVGYVPQENPLIERLSVRDNLSLWYPSKNDLQQALESGLPAEFGLTALAKRPVYKLSGGMKKRLSIACALADAPKILIMDEPTAALDLVCKEDIRMYLRRYLSEGGLVIMTTHEEPELTLCDRIYLMQDGILHQMKMPVSAGDLLDRMRAAHV